MIRMSMKKGQSTLEYAVVIAIVITALLLLGWGWFKGAYQRRLMDASDDISQGQFDEDETTINFTQNRNSHSEERLTTAGGIVSFDTDSTENVSRNATYNTSDLATRKGP